MEMLHIGGVFEPARNNLQGCSMNFFGGGATVVLTMGKPTEEEIQAVENGGIEYKLAVVDDIPFFMAKYGSLPWMEMPVIKYKKHPLELYDGEFEEGSGYPLTTLLCDVPSGVIKAMRVIGMESDVSNALNKAIEQEPLYEAIFDAMQSIVAIQNKYTQEQMLEKATYHGAIIKR